MPATSSSTWESKRPVLSIAFLSSHRQCKLEKGAFEPESRHKLSVQVELEPQTSLYAAKNANQCVTKPPQYATPIQPTIINPCGNVESDMHVTISEIAIKEKLDIVRRGGKGVSSCQGQSTPLEFISTGSQSIPWCIPQWSFQSIRLDPF